MGGELKGTRSKAISRRNVWFREDCHFEMGVEHTSLLSWVSKTATPASTLPTVNETSIFVVLVLQMFQDMLRTTSKLLAAVQ